MSPLAYEPGLVNEDTPLRLSRAVEIAWPEGGMTVSGLRREAARGKLVIERMAGKDFVTLAAIGKMRELCRVEQKEQGSGLGRKSETNTQAPSKKTPSGLSETGQPQDALAALQANLNALSKPSRPTSLAGTNRRAPATVIQIRS